jgi:hypothetical protein
MSRVESLFTQIACVAVGGTGIVYAIMRYLLDPVDEWAVVNHPWQPHVQHLHVLVAPLLVFAVGILWGGHIQPGLRGGSRRGWVTGVGLLVAFAPMVVSGGLLQVVVDPTWRSVWAGLHLSSSALWLGAWLIHPVWVRWSSARVTGRGRRPGPMVSLEE